MKLYVHCEGVGVAELEDTCFVVLIDPEKDTRDEVVKQFLEKARAKFPNSETVSNN